MNLLHEALWCFGRFRWSAVVVFSTVALVRCLLAADAVTGPSEFRRPVLNVSDELRLNCSDNVTLRCVGDLPVYWYVLPATKNQSPSLVNRMETTSGQLGNSSQFYSDLVVTELSHLDTGYYECIYDQDHAESGQKTSTYLYIFDEHRLLVSDGALKWQYVVRNRKSTLPWCRGTGPDVTVTFWSRNKRTNHRQEVDETVAHYDPRRGAVIEKVDDSFDGSFFECVATMNGSSHEMKQDVAFKFLRETRKDPSVTLVVDHREAMTMDTVTFTCNANVQPESRIDLTWTYPNMYRRKSDRIIEVKATKRSRRGGDDVVTGQLIVKNSTKDDSGRYRCIVKDHCDREGSDVRHLAIYEKSFVRLEVKQSAVESKANQRSVVLSVGVTAYPPPKLTWSKDGIELHETMLHGGKYANLKTESLTIFNIHPSDRGLYTLTGKNRDTQTFVNVQLLVNELPTVSIHTPVIEPRLYLVNINHSIECRSTGFPEPKVIWSWQSCSSSDCLPEDDNWETVEQSKNVPLVVTKGSDSRLVVEAKESGWYNCTASNKEGKVSKIMQFFVTKVKDGFGILEDSENRLKEGSYVSASCLASRFHHNLSELYWTVDDNSTDVRLSSNAQINISNFQDEYSLVSRLQLGNVTFDGTSTYTCVARDVSGYERTRIWKPEPFFDYRENSLSLLVISPKPLRHASMSTGHLIVVAVALICVTVIVISVVCVCRRKFRNKFNAVHLEELLRPSTNSKYNPDLPLDEQTEILPYDQQWEFPKDQLKFDVVIGHGAFGTVYRADAFGINGLDSVTTVAVKTVKDSGKLEQLMALISELKVLFHLGHHVNILNALGAVTKDIRHGKLYVIMEYCRYGCLRNYLINQQHQFFNTGSASFQSNRWTKEADLSSGDEIGYLVATETQGRNIICEKERPLSKEDIVSYAFQIARGLDYLHSRKYIHRDLAARNILLADDNVVKICDFGLAKGCYKYSEYRKKSNTPVPIKWMAIESLTHNVYTTKSDIWSYGVVLWELFTVGGNPYPAMSLDKTFIDILESGYRLEKPILAGDMVYQMMLSCWDSDPDLRPNAGQLVETTGAFLEATVKQHYIDLQVQSVDYLRMNSKTGCLESHDSTATDDFTNIRQPRLTIPSYESGFASLTRASDFDTQFEYMPPSVAVKDASDNDGLPLVVFRGDGRRSTAESHQYENSMMSPLTGHDEDFRDDDNDTCRHLMKQHSSRCSYPNSLNDSSGMSDTVFDDDDDDDDEGDDPPKSNRSHPIYHNVFNSPVGVSM